ncbi:MULTISPECIES: hypothetical protein [Burkholderiaceae]|uniref:hypothetical protein n=1 Tax=Burkholderiaceae TaxID=119060 RepID=UPI001FCFB99A|nr:hypothetical protein [Caballeronia sp. Lep1P3]
MPFDRELAAQYFHVQPKPEAWHHNPTKEKSHTRSAAAQEKRSRVVIEARGNAIGCDATRTTFKTHAGA